MEAGKIKLIALDMDGTLLKQDHSVSEENRKAIKKAQQKGVTVMVSTGRPLVYCKEIVESLELASYLITVNGSEIWDADLNLIERTMIDISHIEQMYELAQKHDTHFWSSTVGGVWNKKTEFPKALDEHEWLKFGFDIEDDAIRESIREELSLNKELELSNSSETNIEVNAAGINKAAAIRKVCDRLGFTMDEVMAVGDSLNDLAMINEAGIGVAMGNAQAAVKKAADWVTESNEEDGVAKAIQKFVL
ncbi:Cof-type HAD-IIB family hydrolase [Jeotgalibacillus proteolyticus]|uniref:Phosphoglycolate phosphatase n=1 Tax=Jeotgalibacillus proteolyticus TaxID=2082395 RepID=A0A2S5GA51_9BACL|nr:Cof-type HAD-IIB family hydrolase [Jeotgalibacillus proteolyticus]PPA69793.1 phosphoglycolate phosphatase [Jeotgalibacillus proteolyticus]